MFVGQLSHNSNGYTFIEMLLSLSLFLWITIFVCGTVPLIKYYHYSEEMIFSMDFEVFIQVLKNELLSSEGITITSDRLNLRQGTEYIQYELYNDMIRRRVNGQGHEPMLFNIRAVTFSQENRRLLIAFQFSNGQKWTEEVFIPPSVTMYSDSGGRIHSAAIVVFADVIFNIDIFCNHPVLGRKTILS